MRRRRCAAPASLTLLPLHSTLACGVCAFAVAKLRTVLLNMQHLLNSLRPYQAREELIAILRSQLDAKRQLIEELRSASAECEACNSDEAVAEARQAAASEAARGRKENDGI